MIDQIKSDLALISLNKLNAAILSTGGLAEPNKADAIFVVAQLVFDGQLTIDQVKSMTPVNTVSPTNDLSAVNDRISLLQASAEQCDKEIHSLHQDVRVTNASITALSHDLHGKISDGFQNLESKINQVDKADIQRAISAEVAKVFEPFKQQKTKEDLTEIASKVPSFRLERADALFPNCSYMDGDSTIDFGSMLVGVWDDPNAPQVLPDYVFKPNQLHQTLVALDSDLPDNLWLAGERGTGKTEFVTQIAARLGRRLFRVNFDEAIERADFIGANTIKDGDVVWQAGVIAQAIQYPGSIVLLDEIGFARAQSIAILHSVCERSPNRSIVIPETGERIKVEPHVCFFAADNSNGHGDSSGNFAGVRDQNSAFIDRFGFTLEFDYLSPDDEARLIHNRTSLGMGKCQKIVKFASVAREKSKSGLLTQPPSLRQLFAWARAIKGGMPVSMSFKHAIVNKFPEDTHAELLGVYSATINESTF